MSRKLASFEEFLRDDLLCDARQMCPICLSKQQRLHLLTLWKEPNISLLICQNCKGVSADFMPSERILGDFYKGYYNRLNETDEKVTFHNSKRFAKHILKYVDIEEAEEEIRILDFGGGDGSLSRAVAEILVKKNKKLIIDITLVDIHKQQCQRSNKIRLKYEPSLENIRDKFNIVIASAVLEHIRDVNHVLRKLFCMVEENGFFYARTPEVSYLKRIIKNIDFKYPFHLHDMGGSFWNRIIDIFKLDAELIVSKPAIVQTQFKKDFLRTLGAYLFKLPANIERNLSRGKKDVLWKYSGGWEVVLQMKKAPNFFK